MQLVPERLFLVLAPMLGATFLASEAFSQQTSEYQSAYYRFLSRVPDVAVLEGGGRADLIIEYFASDSGDVAGLSYSAINPLRDSECEIFSRGADICWCDGETDPTKIACIGDDGGPVGGALRTVDLNVIVVPEPDGSGGVDFLVNIERNTVEELEEFTIPGFVFSDDGNLIVKEAVQ